MHKSFTLIDCCEFQEGYVNPSQKFSKYFGGNIKWLRASDLNDGFVINTERSLSEAGYKSAGKSAKMFEKDTIAISKSGTIGSLGVLKDRMCGNRAVINIRVNPELADLMYVFYSLKHKKAEIIGKAGGSIQKNLYVSALETITLNHKDISQQRKIANTLYSLDAKIELNNSINAKLEDMAKTFYNYWFVQFDFPDSNNKPYKSYGGKMVWNEELKRQIPHEWRVGTLLDIAEYTNGLACQKYRPTDHNFLKVIKIREMNEGFSDNSEFVKADIPEKVIVKNGDVLFSWSASLDVKIWTGGNGALNQHIFKVTSKTYPKSFYYFQLVNYLQHFKMMAETRKTTMGHITQEHLQQSRIAIPPIALIMKLDEILAPIFAMKINNEVENQKLSELRDWLLPMLMNNQVKVYE